MSTITMKRIAIPALCLAMLLLFAGCAPTPAPTPSPLATPIITPEETITPPANGQGNGAAQTPDTSSGATPEGNLSTIPDFKEGTVIDPTDMPNITDAFKGKYQDHELVGITHGIMDDNQLYVVEYKDKVGETGRAYLRADASWYEPTGAINTP